MKHKITIFFVFFVLAVGYSQKRPVRSDFFRIDTLTSSERDLIPSDTGKAQLIYNSTTGQFEQRKPGGSWEAFGSAVGGTDDQTASEVDYTNNGQTTVESAIDSLFNRPTGGGDGVVSNVVLNGTDLEFTGSNGGFSSNIDLSSLQDGTGTDDQTLSIPSENQLTIENGNTVAVDTDPNDDITINSRFNYINALLDDWTVSKDGGNQGIFFDNNLTRLFANELDNGSEINLNSNGVATIISRNAAVNENYVFDSNFNSDNDVARKKDLDAQGYLTTEIDGSTTNEIQNLSQVLTEGGDAGNQNINNVSNLTINNRISTSSVEPIRINNDAGYISYYNTAGTKRSGFIQFLATGTTQITNEIGHFQFRDTTGIVFKSSPTKLDIYTNIDLHGNKAIGLANPTNLQDAATKAYVDSEIPTANASSMTIDDTADNFTDDTVEGALAELASGGGSGNGIYGGNGNLSGETTVTMESGENLIFDGAGASDVTIGATGTITADIGIFLNGADMSNDRIVAVADPTNPQDAATKAYVDAAISGVSGGGNSVLLNQTNTATSSTTISTNNRASITIGGSLDELYLRGGTQGTADQVVQEISGDFWAVNFEKTGATSSYEYTLNPDGTPSSNTDLIDLEYFNANAGGAASLTGFHSVETLTDGQTLGYTNQITGSGYRVFNDYYGSGDIEITLDNLRPEANENYIVKAVNDGSVTIKEGTGTFVGYGVGSSNAVRIANGGSVTIRETATNGEFTAEVYDAQTEIEYVELDLTPPTVVSATVENANPNVVVVVFDENTNHNVGGSWPSLSGDINEGFVSVTGEGTNTLSFTYTTDFEEGDTVLLNWGSTTFEDLNSNITPFGSIAITNNVGSANLYAENDAASPTAESNSVGANWFFSDGDLSDSLTSTQGAGVTNGSYALTVTENTGSTFSRARHTGNYGVGTFNLTMDANLLSGGNSARIVVIDGVPGNSTELAAATLSSGANSIDLDFTATVSDWSIMIYITYGGVGNGSIEFDNIVITQ